MCLSMLLLNFPRLWSLDSKKRHPQSEYLKDKAQCVISNLLSNLKIGVFVFSLLSSEIAYEFWIHILYQISVTNIPPPSVCGLFFKIMSFKF